jgi:hypothetical protein
MSASHEVTIMMFAVMIEPYDGQFAATLLGAPTIRAVGTTRDDALRALHTDLAQRLAQGEFVTLEVSVQGVTDLAGTYSTDPTLRDICTEAYRLRDAERHQA